MAFKHLKFIGQSWRAETKRRKSDQKRFTGVETQFLPEALEIVETPPSPIGRMIIWSIMLAFVLAVLWAWFGKIDIVATGQGKIVPAGQIKTVKAPSQGFVREIFVKNGDAVTSGQVLFQMDQSISNSDSDAATSERQRFEARAAVAQGLLTYLDTGRIRFDPPETLTASSTRIHRQQLASRISEYEEERQVLIEERRRAEGSKTGLLQEITKLKTTLPQLQERVTSYRALTAEGLAPRIELMRLEEELTTRTYDLQITQSRVEEVDATLAGLNRRIGLASKSLRQSALTDLAEADGARTYQMEEEKKALARDGWQTVKAPVDGTIFGLQVFTTGDVVAAGAPLLSIAPSDDELVLDVLIMNKDIGFVNIGDPVAVKIEAFPFTRYGLIDGTLSRISADAMVDEQMGPVFSARVTLSEPFVGKDGAKSAIASGMTATAEVKTGKRRIIDFILSPIAKAGSEAGRER